MRAEFERDTLWFAEYLRTRGVTSGDRVLLKGKNSYAFVKALFSLIHLDVSIVLVDHQQTQEETAGAEARSEVRWKVLGKSDEDDLDGRTILYEEWFNKPDRGLPVAGFLSLKQWRSRKDAAILWSSGSTGQPKGVVKSGNSILVNAEQTWRAMGHRTDDVFMPLLPFSHQYGFSTLLIWWLAQCSIVVAPYKLLNKVVDHLVRDGVTIVDATPSTYSSLVALFHRKPALLHELRKVRMWCVGGAPLSKRLADDFSRLLQRSLLDGYGLTEVGNVTVSTIENSKACGTPLRGVQVRVLEEDGTPLPPGLIGEVWVLSDGLMEGYLTNGGTILPTKQGWFPTNDLGYRDVDGNLHIVGRKQAVHRMGHTLYPAYLEKRVESCGCSAKVIALENEKKGSFLVFFVEDTQERPRQYWNRKIRTLLAPHEHPNAVRVVKSFPLNGNGKVDIVKLKHIAMDCIGMSFGRGGSFGT